MGQILSQPVTDKFSETGENKKLYYGVSSMQGWRVSMEDAHAAVLDVKNSASNAAAQAANEALFAYFGVYDGHGGDRTAIYAGEHTHQLVAASPAFGSGDYGKALQDGFLATDAAILDLGAAALDASGCAATAVVVTDKQIVCGNAGDSRTVLGSLGTAKALSFDHKPENEGERSRITAAGGFVDMGRVNGNLALSRAIGDFTFKKTPKVPPEEQVVTGYPDVMEHAIRPNDEFIVLACDGIWDCMHSQEVVEFVRRGIADRLPLTEVCELLMDECLAPESETTGIGCDNMTVCIVALLQGKTKEEWYDTIAERVSKSIGPVAKRTSQEVREGIAARPTVGQSANSAHAQSEDASGAIASPQAMLQQLFSSPDGAGRLNPEATSLLSRLGIRFLGPDVDEMPDYLDPNDTESTIAADEDANASVDHDEGEEDRDALHNEGRTPRDEWND